MLSKLKIVFSSAKKVLIIRKMENVDLVAVYRDMVSSCLRYHIGTNVYVDYKGWKMSDEEKEKQFSILRQRNDWLEKYMVNRVFLNKYSSFDYETSQSKIEERRQAYIKQYGFPQSFRCQHGFILTSEHYGEGSIRVGENFCVARDVDIDLTGDITFGNDVNISEGAKFLTHAHDYDNILGKEIISPDMAYVAPLEVGDDVHFGARCIILPGCNHIGSHSFIGAGAVVTHDVPEWAVVAGNPAKVIKMRTPKVE